uniref:Uncharacterized protein n=1 Tax=Tanacetum cinerariifolium TaxID=118510 RepID=A0A6L2LKU6_TANCI|nr:hypothetical protein [Tanacetum cinerariifolium]
MNNKKRIVNLEYFKEILHICPRIPNQTFDELPFEEEILAFMRNLGHSGETKKITDVNINKLHQPWRSFAAVINKFLSGKSTGYDSLWLSKAQILWGMYHKKNVDFAYLPWEDFFIKLSTKMPRRAMRCTTLDVHGDQACIETSEHSAVRSRTPKTKASVRKTQSISDTTMPPPTATGTRLLTSVKGKQPTKSSKAKGLSILYEVALTEVEQINDVVDDDDDDDQVDEDEQDNDDQDDNNDDQDSDNDGNDDASHGMNVEGDEGPDAEDDDDELHGDLNINLKGIDSLFESTPWVDVPVTTTVVPLLVTAPTLPLPFIPIISQFAEAVSSNPDIVDRYVDHRMNKSVKVSVQLQSDRLLDEAQAENVDFLNKFNENIKKIIKEQVKEQVKTSYDVAADLSELELKKILIEKMESNKIKMKNPPLDQTRGPREDEQVKSQSQPVLQRKRHPRPLASLQGSKPHQKTASESAPAEEPMQTSQDLEVPAHLEFETDVADDKPIAEASQHLEWFQKQTKPPTPEHAYNKTLPFYGFAINKESARDVYSNLESLLSPNIRSSNDITTSIWIGHLCVEMMTSSINSRKVITRGFALKTCVESYQKKLNLTKSNMYRSDLKCKKAYTAYSNPRGFIYKNKDKQNRLMRIDELHKFSDDTLNDVRTALDDRLKRI